MELLTCRHRPQQQGKQGSCDCAPALTFASLSSTAKAKYRPNRTRYAPARSSHLHAATRHILLACRPAPALQSRPVTPKPPCPHPGSRPPTCAMASSSGSHRTAMSVGVMTSCCPWPWPRPCCPPPAAALNSSWPEGDVALVHVLVSSTWAVREGDMGAGSMHKLASDQVPKPDLPQGRGQGGTAGVDVYSMAEHQGTVSSK